MARQPLPDPQWLPIEPRNCLRCGYALAGLGDSGACPECGEGFATHYLHLAGVPKSGSSGSRRVLWTVLIIVSIVQAYTWVLQPRFLCSIIGVAVAGGFIAMFLTSRRERSGIERYIISPGGICRRPFKAASAKAESAASKIDRVPDSLFVDWGDSDAVHLKRLGAVWRQMQIGSVTPGGVFKDVVFEAGIRCPDESAEMVRGTIQQMLQDHVTRKSHRSPARSPDAESPGWRGPRPPDTGTPVG